MFVLDGDLGVFVDGARADDVQMESAFFHAVLDLGVGFATAPNEPRLVAVGPRVHADLGAVAR